MSRLFDALKEATRFREDTAGIAGEGVWEALGINGIGGAPPVSNGAKAIEVGPTAPAVVLAKEDTPVSIPVRPLAFLGNPAAAALDKRARLIPNSTDPIVVE